GDSMYENFRVPILKQLSKQSYSDFILRDVWANIEQLKGSPFIRSEDKRSPSESRRQFTRNIRANLYGLCIRGGGNFSFRLGEVLMMGRIPVLIDSECILPFRDEIPYKTHTVYVTRDNSRNFKDVDSVIRRYHDKHSNEELLRIQRENRKIWEAYFTVA